jgi:hypothetical protein
MSAVANAPGVIWSELDAERHTDAFRGSSIDGIDAPPDDPFFSLQWALHAVHAEAAWDITRGDTGVVVAVVDVGCDTRHGDLVRKLWANPLEASGRTGVDDDGNGFIDDVNGWDFIDDDNDPRPSSGDAHGTHVAGIAVAATDNGYGIAGMGWNCRLMSIRSGLSTSITRGFEGLIYAVDAGAQIINLSWGSEQVSQIERVAIDYAIEHGSMVIAAAGNTFGAGQFDHYPAAYDQVLAVASTNDHDLRSSFSNVGPWVDISAPGSSIFSLTPNAGYGVLSGTSMATPLVSGAAALVKSIHPEWTPDRIRLQLVNSADRIDSLNPGYLGMLGSGRMNVYRALRDYRAALELVSFRYEDLGDSDGVIDPGEHLLIYPTLVNRLQKAVQITGRLTTSDANIQINQPNVTFELIEGGETSILTGDPLEVRISYNSAEGRAVNCSLEVTSMENQVWRFPISLMVRAPSADIKAGNVSLTVTDFGSLGYYDYRNDIGYGNGFRYPLDGLSSLFHGSFFLAADGGRVSDNAYGDTEMSRYDLVATERGITLLETDSTAVANSIFSDQRAEHPLGLTIRQEARSFYTASDDDYILLSYTIKLSPNASAIDSLYAGLFLDWDVIQADDNLLNWDPVHGVGWVSRAHHQAPVVGGAMVEGIISFQAGVRSLDMTHNWSDSLKWEAVLSGFARAEGEEIDDWAQMFGTGPRSLQPGDSFHVAFVVAGGDDPESFKASVLRARARSGNTFHEANPFVPLKLEFHGAYPMPFNNRTNLSFLIPSSGSYCWRLIDPMGRTMQTGTGVVDNPGYHIIPFEGEAMPAGKYFFSLDANSQRISVPLILQK